MDNIQSIQILCIHSIKSEFGSFPAGELISLIELYEGMPNLKYLFQNEPKTLSIEACHPYEYQPQNFSYLPFVRLAFPSPSKILKREDLLHKQLTQICDRSVLTASFLVLLAFGNSVEDLKNNIVDQEQFDYYTQDEEQIFCFDVYTAHRNTTSQEQLQMINYVTDLFNFKGLVKMKNSTRRYWICDYHEPFDRGNRPEYKDTVKQVYLGVEICYNRYKQKHFSAEFDLPTRAYLGPTSTNVTLSFLMCNQAKVQRDQVIYDPFVGTGSLLVAAAYFGAFTYGSDIDVRVLHGHGVGQLNKNSKMKLPENPVKPYMFYNFIQYGFPVPELVRQDFIQCTFRDGCEFFDAIICDPPYGIRAVSRETGQKVRQKILQQEEQKKQQDPEEENKDMTTAPGNDKAKPFIIPTKQVNHLTIYKQLFDAAYKVLKPGGRLVYLYPFDREEKGEAKLSDIPLNEHFDLINFSEERFNQTKSRILITMQKKTLNS